MNEHYEGDEQDQRFIEEYLQNVRALALRSPEAGVTSLETILSDSGTADFDAERFRQLCEQTVERLRARWPEFKGLPFARCLVRRQTSPEDTGGFHSAYGRGFDQFGAVSFCVTLNPSVAPNERLRTLELLRGYIHDSIHAQTFKIFRRVPVDYVEASRPVYRAQYGVNFRRPWGTSYSTRDLTEEVPIQINLNLLMDGATMWLAADALRPEIEGVSEAELTDFERAVIADIDVQWEPRVLWPAAARFYVTVSLPTKAFLTYWGGDDVRDVLYGAMFSGELEPIKQYFDERDGESRAWDRLFKNPVWDQVPASPLGSRLNYRD